MTGLSRRRYFEEVTLTLAIYMGFLGVVGGPIAAFLGFGTVRANAAATLVVIGGLVILSMFTSGDY